MNTNIAFIGAGNMASALIEGLITENFIAEHIHAADSSQEKLTQLRTRLGIKVYSDNRQAIAQADVVILAVKPQVMHVVCSELKAALTKQKPLIISLAAGINLHTLERWLNCELSIVRCMPNTPALVQCGASGLYANAQVSATEKKCAQHILDSVGITAWLAQEELLDAVTAVSGSGPAYFFRIIEIMTKIAKEQGLDAELSKALVLQTMRGATQMAERSEVDIATLRQQVTSPQGTTAAALDVFDAGNLEQLFRSALQAANQRAKSLAIELAQI